MNRKNREIKKAKNPRLSIQTFQINQKLTEFLTAVKYPIRK